MPKRFEWFTHNENIKNFERRLETETDPERFALLKTLLREEKDRVPEEDPETLLVRLLRKAG